jgi:type IV secretory pathway VirB2 component (pilin)
MLALTEPQFIAICQAMTWFFRVIGPVALVVAAVGVVYCGVLCLRAYREEQKRL